MAALLRLPTKERDLLSLTRKDHEKGGKINRETTVKLKTHIEKKLENETRRFISGIKNLNLNNLNYQLFKFYMESTRGYLNFSLVLSSCYIKSICSHLNLTHRPYTINAIFVLLLFKIAISASCLLRRLYKIYMV